MSSCMYYLTLEYFFLGLMKYSDSDNANVFFYISHTISHIFYIYFMFLVIYFYMVYIS